MNRFAHIAATVMAALCFQPFAVSADEPAQLPDAASLWFLADVVIEPDGRVSDVEWRNYKAMPGEALADLERRMSAWKFQPGEIGGAPVATGTSLVIQVVAIERPDGRFGMEIAQVVPGPSLVDAWLKPSSPYREVLTSGSLKSGFMVLDAAFDPGGPSQVDILEFETSTGNRRYRAAFERDSLAFPEDWTVRHETVAGTPVVARFRFENRICWNHDWCDAHAAASMAGLPTMPYEQPVPMNSVVRLLTDVSTVRILPELPVTVTEHR